MIRSIFKGYKNLFKGDAVKFIILMGIVSLFADMTYEGSRNIIGLYLAE